MRRKTLGLSLLAAAVLTMPIWSAAAMKETKELVKTGYKTAPGGEGYLTKEMIEACILLKKDIDGSYDEINKVKAEFDALNKETTELGAYIKDNAERVSKETDKAIRDDYEAKVETYNGKIPKLNSMLENYTKMSEAYTVKTAKFDKECNNQSYYEDDHEEMKKKLGYGLNEGAQEEPKKPEAGK